MDINLPIRYNHFLQAGCLHIRKEWFRGNLLVALRFFMKPVYSAVKTLLRQVA